MPRRQGLHADKRCARRQAAPEGTHFCQTDWIQFRLQPLPREQRLRLRCEGQPFARPGVVQRTDADTITGQHQSPFTRIPQCNRKLTVQLLYKVQAMLLIRVDDDFGVRVRIEAMPGQFQLAAQLDVIEYLAIEDQLDGTGLVVNRLVTGGQINDAESRVRQANARRAVVAKTVRATVANGANHAREPRPVGHGTRFGHYHAGNTTHCAIR